MIYEHFSMRIHGQPSWDIQTGGNAFLAKFYVGSVSIPDPVVKYQNVDVPGSNGLVDYTDSPNVTFNMRNVEVILQGEAGASINMTTVESNLSSYQGRVVDFTFDDSSSVSRFYTGRMTMHTNRHKNRIFLSFVCEPLKYSETVYERTMSVLSNYERNVNSTAWTLGTISGGGGDLDYVTESSTASETRTFVYFDSAPGALFERVKSISGNNGKYLAFGLVSIVGGDVWFEWTENGQTIQSKTMAKVVNGAITMKCHIDGSYYEWRTVNNNRVYYPTIRCTYIMSNFLPMSDGEPSGAVSMIFPANAIIIPDVNTLNANGYLICDGVAAETNISPFDEVLPRVTLPGKRADYSSDYVTSIYAVIPRTASQSPTTKLKFRKAEVF